MVLCQGVIKVSGISAKCLKTCKSGWNLEYALMHA